MDAIRWTRFGPAVAAALAMVALGCDGFISEPADGDAGVLDGGDGGALDGGDGAGDGDEMDGGGNQPPTVEIAEGDQTVDNGVSATFTAVGSDPDGDTLAYSWFVDDQEQSGETTASFSLARSPTAETTYAIRVEVSDGTDQASAVANLTVRAGGGSGHGGALEALANSLAAGQAEPFPEGQGNPLNSQQMAWQAHFHYDPTRHECSVLGDSQSNQAPDDKLHHARFDLATSGWVLAHEDISAELGHVYGNNTDDGEGNIFFHSWSRTDVYAYSRDSDRWAVGTSADDLLDSGAGLNGNGLAWHPNLYGGGGLVFMNLRRIVGWNAGADTWELLLELDAADNNLSSGIGVYLPGADRVVIGRDVLFAVDANGEVIRLGEPPIAAAGTSTIYGAIFGTLHVHPSKPELLVLIERDTDASSQGRVWTSPDGVTWTPRGADNPLRGHASRCSITDYGVFWGIGPDPDSSMLWKPDF